MVMISNTVAAVAIAGLWAGIFSAAIMSGLWGQSGSRRPARRQLRPNDEPPGFHATAILRTVFVLAALVCATSADAHEDARSTEEGEVALTDSPFCEFFVVKTPGAFSLVEWRGGLYVFSEGDRMRGRLNTPGMQAFEFIDQGEMKVLVEDAGVDVGRAQKAYYSRCHPSPSPRPEIVASR